MKKRNQQALDDSYSQRKLQGEGQRYQTAISEEETSLPQLLPTLRLEVSLDTHIAVCTLDRHSGQLTLIFNKALQGLLAEMSERSVKVSKGICCLCGLNRLLSLKLQHKVHAT